MPVFTLSQVGTNEMKINNDTAAGLLVGSLTILLTSPYQRTTCLLLYCQNLTPSMSQRGVDHRLVQLVITLIHSLISPQSMNNQSDPMILCIQMEAT